MSVTNKYNAPIRVWGSFTTQGKQRFNHFMEKTLGNQSRLIHPEALPMPNTEWQQICYNMACIAAWGLIDWEFTTDNHNIFTDTHKLTRLGYSKQ